MQNFSVQSALTFLLFSQSDGNTFSLQPFGAESKPISTARAAFFPARLFSRAWHSLHILLGILIGSGSLVFLTR